MKRVEAVIKGLVQDVGFRRVVSELAGELGITGRVWNRPDGSVGLVAEGNEPALRQLLDWPQYDPPVSVTDVKVTWNPATGEFTDFQRR